ncbi:hypothetical protein Lser_V15G39179 [Lactuca serriola]
MGGQHEASSLRDESSYLMNQKRHRGMDNPLNHGMVNIDLGGLLIEAANR